jgi:Sulfatase-modifying factor enzyme 1
MVWIAPGALVAGTPPNDLPRVADEEMPGEQVILHGFYIDVFPYPDEPGAIPVTDVTENEAEALCKTHGKRLCSELEWERACKGPDNETYEYGNQYRPERCRTGEAPALRPAGLNVSCHSDFGVRDMHGGAWEWTDSPWGRGTRGHLVTVRGGNAPDGELVGRCANGMGRRPGTKSPTLGFRCCVGPENDAQVVLQVRRGKPLEDALRIDKKLAAELKTLFPADAHAEVADPGAFAFDRQWTWRPIGNEKLFVLGGCATGVAHPACGVLVARVTLDRPKVLGWASSGHWVPVVHADVDAKDLWLFGGDDLGSFRRLVAYAWGSLKVGQRERHVPKLSRHARR